MIGEERLRARLGDLLRRRSGAPRRPRAPAFGVGDRAAAPRRALDHSGILPGREVATARGPVHVHELERGAADRGYAPLLARLAEARERLELLPESGLHRDFAELQRSGLERALLLDLETAGFAGSPVFLAGLMTVAPGRVRLRQILARHYLEEPALIAEVAAVVSAHPLVVTYNGKSFDLPMLADRALRYRIGWTPPPAHLDLLPHARRAFRGRAPNCRLVTLEWLVCRRHRLGDVGGREVPDRVHRFAREGDPGAILPVLHHNALDLVTLAELLARLVPDPPGPRFVPDEAGALLGGGESPPRRGMDVASATGRAPGAAALRTRA